MPSSRPTPLARSKALPRDLQFQLEPMTLTFIDQYLAEMQKMLPRLTKDVHELPYLPLDKELCEEKPLFTKCSQDPIYNGMIEILACFLFRFAQTTVSRVILFGKSLLYTHAHLSHIQTINRLKENWFQKGNPARVSHAGRAPYHNNTGSTSLQPINLL